MWTAHAQQGKFVKVVGGSGGFTQAEREDFWNHVAFYNCIQAALEKQGIGRAIRKTFDFVLMKLLTKMLQAFVAYVCAFVVGGLLGPSGDISYRECVIRDGLYGLIVCGVTTLFLSKLLHPFLLGCLFAAALLAAFSYADSHPFSIISKILF